MSIPSRPLSRALRAALAVTLAGNAAACGTDPTSAEDAGVENGADTAADGELGDSITGDDDTTDTGDEDGAPLEDVPDSLAHRDTESADVVPDTEPLDVEVDTQLPDLGVDADPIRSDVLADATDPDAVDTVDVQADASPDTIGDDVQADVVDAAPEVISVPLCKDETDEICPEDCTEHNDYDCCVGREDEGLYCTYFGDGAGCGCAAEGPFAPPSTRRLLA